MSEREPKYEIDLKGLDLNLGKPDSIPTRLKEYNKLGLGRSINFLSQDPAGNFTSEQLAYMLPMDEEEKNYLIIENSGRMFVMEPQDNTPYSITEYKRIFAPSPDPYFITIGNDSPINKEATLIRNIYPHFIQGFARVARTNYSGPNIEEFNGIIRRAEDTALVLRSRRIEGIERTTEYLLSENLEEPITTPFPSTHNLGEVYYFPPDICY